jgi:DNA-binding transcriptional LysR family regulator
LRVGLLESASWAGHVPRALHRFKRRHERIRLDIRPLSSVAQIDALMAGEIDAAFVYRQDNIVEDALTLRRLRVDDVVLAASTELVFDRDGPLLLEDIDGLPIVAFPHRVAPAYHDRLFGALAASVSRRRSFRKPRMKARC